MMWLPNSPWTWTFALIAVLQAIIALAIEGYVFAQFEVNLLPNSKGTSASHSIPTYLALFIFGFLYQLVLVYDALRAKNTIQVIGLCLYNAGMLIYSGVQIAQVKEAVDTLIYPPGGGEPQITPDIWEKLYWFLLACPCVIALGTILLSGVAWKLYHEFAWTIYKNISADLRLKRRYLTFQVSYDFLADTRAEHPTDLLPDLHRSPQVRFLLLSCLHRPIPCHRRLKLHRL
jgi:hypothetical protein